MKCPDGLVGKQRKFCDEYLVHFDGAKAARSAGHSEKTARSIAAENLTKPNIIKYLTKRRKKLQEKIEIDQEWVLNNFKEMVERSMQHKPALDKEGNKTGEYRYEGILAHKANESIGKHLGFFNEDESGDKTKPLVIKIQTTKE